MNFSQAATAALIAMAATAAHADGPPPLLSEGFDSVAGLSSGWTLTNASTPGGTTGWFQGDAGIFAAQAGAADSYIAANFNNAPLGGTISNWLIGPTFSTELAGTVSFWARGAADEGFADHLDFGISDSGSSAIGSFVLGSVVTVSGDWTQYSFNYSAHGAGSTARFGIHYTGLADESNYVGIDTVTVTPVPEPSTWLLFGAGLLGLVIRSRRRAAAR